MKIIKINILALMALLGYGSLVDAATGDDKKESPAQALARIEEQLVRTKDVLKAAELGMIGAIDELVVNQKMNTQGLTDEQGNNAVMRAVIGHNTTQQQGSNHPAVIHILLKYGNSTIDHTNKDGNTALMLAVETADLPLVQYLVGRGASTQIKNNNKQTALTLAQEKKRSSRDHKDTYTKIMNVLTNATQNK
jgi:ankyrin repeat protein